MNTVHTYIHKKKKKTVLFHSFSEDKTKCGRREKVAQERHWLAMSSM